MKQFAITVLWCAAMDIALCFPSLDTDHSTNAERLRWLHRWGKSTKTIVTYQPQRPTILIVTSVETCLSCGGAGIKETLELIERIKPSANVYVVATVGAIGDAKKLRKLFPSTPLIEDDENIITTVFEVDTIPIVLIIGSDGSIVYRHADPSHRPLQAEILLNYVTPILQAHTRTIPKGIRLNEGSYSLATISAGLVDLSNDRAILLDKVNNQLAIADLKTGNVLQCLEPDSSIDLYFLPGKQIIKYPSGREDTIWFDKIRQLFLRHYIPMTRFITIAGYQNDTCWVIAEMCTAPTYDIDSSKEKYSISFINSHVLLTMILRHNHPPHILNANKTSDSRAVMGLNLAWTALPYYSTMENSRILFLALPSNHDSITSHNLAVAEYSIPNSTTTYRSISKTPGKSITVVTDTSVDIFDQNFDVRIASNHYVLLLPLFHRFLRCIPNDSALTCEKYFPSTRLQKIYQSANSDSLPEWRYVQLLMIEDKPSIAYLCSQRRQVVIEHYTDDGIAYREITITIQSPSKNDQLLDARILEPIGDRCIILCKWKKKRWYLYHTRLTQ